uniref:Uncharacterized protein n=1 Tax=Hyaloperonospora arabidopsidis (strain Emoy2) TaxID=559515 RepID=M4C0E6_HYAAE
MEEGKLRGAGLVLSIYLLQRRMQQGNCFNWHKLGHRMGDCSVMKKPGGNGKQTTFTKKSKSKLVKAERSPARDSRSSRIQQYVITSDKAELDPEHVAVDNMVFKDTSSVPGNHSIWEWCFGNASASNVHVASNLRYFIDYEPFPERMQIDSVQEFHKEFTTTPVGHGSVQLLVECDSQNRIMMLYGI